MTKFLEGCNANFFISVLPCYVSFILLVCVYHINVWSTFIFCLSAALV